MQSWASKQRYASRAEAAEAKSSLEAVSCQMHEQAKACSPTDHSVRNFKDGLGIVNMTIKTFVTFPDLVIFCYPYSSTSMDRGLRRVVHAAVATTQTKPQAQQQLARDLEMERAAMGRRRRPQSFGKVQRGNSQPCR